MKQYILMYYKGIHWLHLQGRYQTTWQH